MVVWRDIAGDKDPFTTDRMGVKEFAEITFLYCL